MKNKLHKLIFSITLVIVLGCTTVNAETITRGTCSYNVEGINVVVTQNVEDIIVSYSGEAGQLSNIYKNYNKSGNKIEKKEFFNSDMTFKCPTLYAVGWEDVSQATADGSVPTFWSIRTSKKGYNTAESYNGTLKAAETCSYSKQLTYTKCTVEVTPASGNGIDVKTKGECGSFLNKLDKSYFYKNGKFTCATTYFNYQTLNGVEYVTVANTKDQTSNPTVPSEEIITETEPEFDDGMYKPAEKVELEGIAACELIGENSKVAKQIKQIIWIVRVAIPILIIILSIIEFMKILLLDDDKVYKQAWTRFLKRCLAGIVFFLIPSILRLLFVITDVLNIYSLSPDSIFCYLI